MRQGEEPSGYLLVLTFMSCYRSQQSLTIRLRYFESPKGLPEIYSSSFTFYLQAHKIKAQLAKYRTKHRSFSIAFKGTLAEAEKKLYKSLHKS